MNLNSSFLLFQRLQDFLIMQKIDHVHTNTCNYIFELCLSLMIDHKTLSPFQKSVFAVIYENKRVGYF